ncbi:MAG: hypothetical protein ACTIJR_16505 [Brevibacterium linens]
MERKDHTDGVRRSLGSLAPFDGSQQVNAHFNVTPSPSPILLSDDTNDEPANLGGGNLFIGLLSLYGEFFTEASGPGQLPTAM